MRLLLPARCTWDHLLDQRQQPERGRGHFDMARGDLTVYRVAVRRWLAALAVSYVLGTIAGHVLHHRYAH